MASPSSVNLFVETCIADEHVCVINTTNFCGANIETEFDKIDDFLLTKADPNDIYQRRFFKEKENDNDESNYLKFLKFVDDQGNCVYGIIRSSDGYLLGFITKIKGGQLPLNKNPYHVFLFALKSTKDDRGKKARRLLDELGFSEKYTSDLWFQEGYWSMTGAAKCKRHELHICKEEFLIAFTALFNHTKGEQNTSVPKALLYIVQVFLECVRINLQRTIVIVSFDKGLYLDEKIIRYQHGVSSASLFHRLDRGHSDQTRLFRFIVDSVELGLVEVNDIYGRYVEGGLTGRRTIDLQHEYDTSQKPIIRKGKGNQ